MARCQPQVTRCEGGQVTPLYPAPGPSEQLHEVGQQPGEGGGVFIVTSCLNFYLTGSAVNVRNSTPLSWTPSSLEMTYR